ncbi:aldo-keto reductase AKR2E4-like [Vanessa atalanta]|uniref:aldo-keto reductase AKR2E4-like n=1 Tax=Vanessa atalanta TaxID=42275 RepID=UPI001FCD1B0C|nr:aldo-keto reductase AKR2E4-like [Vanessa atalanta]
MHCIFLLVLVGLSVVATEKLERTKLLNDGNRIPIVSFGTFGRTIDIAEKVKPAVIQAIKSGYRHIDTAALYKNEEAIGEAIAYVISQGIIRREDLWVTTKVNFDATTREEVLPALQASLKRLKLDYVDLYLIHSPINPLSSENGMHYLDVWKGMEDMKRLKLARSIGVSNFNSSEINKILVNSNTVPSVNQIEVNPTYTDLELVAYCQSLNITVLSYAPFGFMVPRPYVADPTNSTFEEPILVKLAKKYGKTTNQVVIRYLVTTADALPNTKLLNDGNRIPIVAYGTFGKTNEVEIIKPASIKAIEAGYRHIDTAAVYQNEEQVGEAVDDVIKRGIVKREDLWITTKV